MFGIGFALGVIVGGNLGVVLMALFKFHKSE